MHEEGARVQRLKQGCGPVQGAEDEIALEEWEGDAVVGAGDGVWCNVCFQLRDHLKSPPRITALECHGARGCGDAGATTACARTCSRSSSGNKAMVKK
jgi:hypothetical protein